MRGGVRSAAVRATVMAKATRHSTADSPRRSAMIQAPKQVTNSAMLPPRVPVTNGFTKRSTRASSMPRMIPPGAARVSLAARPASMPPWA